MNWTGVAPLPAARTSIAAASDSLGRIYAVGGSSSAGSGASASVYRYDPATDTWSTLAALPEARSGAAVTVGNDDRVYLLCGFDGTLQNFDLLRYDPTTDTWSGAGVLPQQRFGVAAATDNNGRIYSIGGYTGAVAPTTGVYRYDPAADTWSTLASLPVARAEASAVCGADGRIYVLGGGSARLDRYDPVSNTWTQLADLPVARSARAAVDGRGRIYAVGGGTKRVDRYDPTTGVWEQVTDLATSRESHGVGTDADGNLYAIGGQDGVTVLASVERFTANRAPNAPALLSPADGSTIDLNAAQRFRWQFSDPDTGDTQSYAIMRWRPVGNAVWFTATVSGPNQFHDLPAGTLLAGDCEWQVQTDDAEGATGPWSTSGFFTAAVPTGVPTITAPVSGGTVGSDPATVSWSTVGGQDAYQIRRVADNAGAPDELTVYYDTGQVDSTSGRSASIPFETNDRYEHIQARIYLDGLWSSWASIRVLVSYTAPGVPTYTIVPDNEAGSLQVLISNPTPGASEPSVAYNDVYVDDGGGETRRATGVAPSGSWWYMLPVSGRDYTGHVRVVAVGDNGITRSSL